MPAQGLEMMPFLVDMVHAVLTMASKADEKSVWVLRILACTVQRLACIICERRLESKGSGLQLDDAVPLQVSLNDGSQVPSSAMAVSAFFSGKLMGWKPPRRRDGFFLHDLGLCLDEDSEETGESEMEESSRASTAAKGFEGSGNASTGGGRYDQERRVASSVVMWARNFLQFPDAGPRHLAHVAVIHGLTVLSTRVKDLLPHVHSVWQHMTPSFSDGAAMAALADSCVLLKHMARLSGDFIKRRFFSDCWPGIWQRLKATDVVQGSCTWSSAMKMQWAALDAIVFLAGDSSLVRGISEQLIALGIKFANPLVAGRLRSLSWSLLQQMAKVDADLLWMYVQALESPDSQPWSATFLLAEVAPAGLQAEDLTRLKGMVESEDSQPWCPRVALGVGGDLWCDALVRVKMKTASGARLEFAVQAKKTTCPKYIKL